MLSNFTIRSNYMRNQGEAFSTTLKLQSQRAYSEPKLTVYGALADLTATGSANNNEAANRPCSAVEPSLNFQVNCMT